MVTAQGRFAIKLGLDRTRAVLEAAGNPQAGKRGALIAGTNGKGSTAAFLASILTHAGRRVGTTPSPHLSSYTERVQVDGRPIDEAEFAAALESVRPALDAVVPTHGPATEFEILIALALNHLAPRVDRLVIEVGLGGRLDATNVLDLGVAIVTNVALDHMQYLGSTVEAIAAEKAAIIKPGNAALTGASGAALRVVERAAAEVHAPLWRIGHEIRLDGRSMGWDGSLIEVRGPGFHHPAVRVPLLGSHQGTNASLAIAAAHAIGDATTAAVEDGIAAARWPGRLEVFPGHPRVILDGAHNPAALGRVARDLRRLLADETLVVVFACMADKDVGGILEQARALKPRGIVFTAAATAGPRGADPALLAETWGPGSHQAVAALEALGLARDLAGREGTVLVCGSLYLVGEVRAALGA